MYIARRLLTSTVTHFMIRKISDVPETLQQARSDPQTAYAAILKLAQSDDWGEREVAATLLVEAGKKHASAIVDEMMRWADDENPNVRRTASEGLRGITGKNPDLVLPVLNKLRADENLYVKKSVANVLRNAGNYHPEFVLDTCRQWSEDKNVNTAWIIKDGLRKLKKSYPEEVDRILKISK